MAVEEWRTIPGWEGYYEVSSTGRVRSVRRAGRRTTRVLKTRINPKGGHVIAALCRDSIQKRIGVHRLVLLAFVGQPPDGMEACHRDGNPINNVTENLRWGTHEENMQDRTRHGRVWQTKRTHCPSGHEYSEENTCRPPGRNQRICRTCRSEINRRSKERKRREAGIPVRKFRTPMKENTQ